MIPTDVAYMAGLFDGEGHIAIAYKRGSGTGKNAYPRYWLMVSMSQNNREAISWLVGKVGGSMRFVSGERSYDRGMYHRWNWTLSTASAAKFLALIQPYSIVKAEEIRIALQFQATMDANLGRSRVSPEVVEFRRACYQNIRLLRGSKAVLGANPQ